MIKTMNARYPGRDAHTGQRFSVGAEIRYDTVTRKAWLSDAPIRADYVSDIVDFGDGKQYYRNKNGRCEDAPCCGCCTI